MLVPLSLLSRPPKPRRVATGLIVSALALLALPGVAWAAPDFTVTPQEPIPGQAVEFEASALETGDTASWNFGDGSLPETGGTVVHPFTAAGSYDVVMTVLPGGQMVTKTIDVNTPPVAAFEFAPTVPNPGQGVLFSAADSSDADGDTLTYSWDFGDGGTGEGVSPSHAFAAAGSYTVELTVSDGVASRTASATVLVGAPTVVVSGPSGVALTGTSVSLSATCTPSAGNSACAMVWDLDGDGFDDGTGGSVSPTFTVPGVRVVRVRGTQQPNGMSTTATFVLRVNAPPVAGFVWSPSSPLAGATVELVSTSVDAEGPIRHAWELDGDGDFNDATTATATAAFAAGTRSVGLRVTDGDGVSRTVTRQITVLAPAPVQPASPQPAPRVLSPVVRLAGTLLPRGTRVRILSVRAPRGALVTARCRGRGCPIRSQRRRSRTGFVRFRSMEGLLRPRARVEVLVQARGAIGRYTRFTIRAGKRPKRTDLCLPPGSSVPQRECGA